MSHSYEEYIEKLFDKAIYLDPGKGNFCSENWPKNPQRPNLSSKTNPSSKLTPNFPSWLKSVLPQNVTEEDLNQDSVLVMFFDLKKGYHPVDKIFYAIQMVRNLYVILKKSYSEGDILRNTFNVIECLSFKINLYIIILSQP